MSKITKTETITYCNFCQAEDNSHVPIPLGWFRVASVYTEMRKGVQRDVDLCEGQDWHACSHCGLTLHNWLELLGIDHTFIPAKDEFRESSPQWGHILVGVKGKA